MKSYESGINPNQDSEIHTHLPKLKILYFPDVTVRQQ